MTGNATIAIDVLNRQFLLDCPTEAVEQIEELEPVVDDTGQRSIRLRIPRFGIRTLRFSDVQSSRPE